MVHGFLSIAIEYGQLETVCQNIHDVDSVGVTEDFKADRFVSHE